MRQFLVVFLIYFGLLCGMFEGSAIASTYDEATSDDLNGSNLTLTLDAGLNTVTGSQQVGANWDSDSFHLNLLDGFVLDSITLNTSNIVFFDGTTTVESSFGLRFDGSPLDSLTWTSASSTQSFDATSLLPLSDSGVYWILNYGAGHSGTTPNLGGSWDYIWEINVSESTSAVPEPTTVMLFGIGLLGLAGVSRKKS